MKHAHDLPVVAGNREKTHIESLENIRGLIERKRFIHRNAQLISGAANDVESRCMQMRQRRMLSVAKTINRADRVTAGIRFGFKRLNRLNMQVGHFQVSAKSNPRRSPAPVKLRL